MGNEPNKFTQYLDQLMPFLESAPTWLKIWIYILIFLIFLTLAAISISYLVSKDKRITASSLKYFSVANPQNNGEIPLGETKTWILEGNYPVIEDDELAKTAKIEVEVFKTKPERKEIKQSGKTRISTIDGTWSFESAQFADEGLHEIIVSAFLGVRNVYRRLKVNCITKANLYRKAIEKDRQIRGARELLLANPEEVSLPVVHQELYKMQNDFFEHYPRDLESSRVTISKTLEIVDRLLPLFPNDLYLQNVRAYTFKNYAMVMERLNRQNEFNRALDESEKMFKAIREQDPQDAGAWNGLGSVSLLRRDPQKALTYIDRALEINPNYKEALHDKNLALGMLEEQKKSEENDK
jgi:hypothetical protein